MVTGMTKKILYLVISDSPQSGKTTISNFISSTKNCQRMSSSDAILPRVARLTGIPQQVIKSRRQTDPDFCRQELIKEGDKMAAEGYPPGVACLDMLPNNKSIVIDGIRRTGELAKTIEKARNMGYDVYVIAVTRPNIKSTNDNTERELFNYADYMIINDKGIEELLENARAILEKIDRKVFGEDKTGIL